MPRPEMDTVISLRNIDFSPPRHVYVSRLFSLSADKINNNNKTVFLPVQQVKVFLRRFVLLNVTLNVSSSYDTDKRSDAVSFHSFF